VQFSWALTRKSLSTQRLTLTSSLVSATTLVARPAYPAATGKLDSQICVTMAPWPITSTGFTPATVDESARHHVKLGWNSACRGAIVVWSAALLRTRKGLGLRQPNRPRWAGNR
jgi:hypothetical protein